MKGFIFSSPELAQGGLLGYRNVPSYVWTSVTSETYETSQMSQDIRPSTF